MSSPQYSGPLSLPFEIHVKGHEALWADVSRATRPSHVVVTPVNLHKRNIETRLRKASRPKSSLIFERIGGLAGEIADAGGHPRSALDHVDRLALLREILAEVDNDVFGHLGAVVGDPLSNHVETLERTRSELELVTGFNRTRMRAFADALDDRDDPAAVDTRDLLAGISQVHDDLRRRLAPDGNRDDTDSSPRQAVSETSLLCRATRALHDDPGVWDTTYPGIDRLSIAGTNMLTAPLEDFCRVVGRTTDVDVHIYLRAASGPAIRDQLDLAAPVDDPGKQEVFTWR